jgi:dolichol kinase
MSIKPSLEMERETARQVFHALLGAAALATLLLFGREFAVGLLFFIIIGGTFLMNKRLLGERVPVVQWLEWQFERPDAPLPGWGSACYAAGVLLLLTFLTDANEIAASLVVLGLGDAISTIVGARGRIALPYNGDKTLEGAAAFFLVSLGAWYFVGPAAIPLAAVATIAESLPWLEDNLAIPVACVLFFLVL